MQTLIPTAKRIHQLSPELASQIAAGEVIERPASVLKELLENSIDSAATQIDVRIEHGGVQLIEVRDNGQGILKEDLPLALLQHATSKIKSQDDLAAICSLGFRGEALASIDSVARLTITSRTSEQQHAWAINNQQIVPAAHPIGTTICMRDLFYNIPARRKFLRSERTEYQHLEEIFRRIALSNFNVGFSLTHQEKLVKSLPNCRDAAARTRRVINLCGQQVMTNAVTIDAEQNGLRLWGWLGSAEHARSQEAHQYFFINQRVIRDRLINHAIREVYQPLCAEGKMPFYCLYLELDPVALDVNVHPTKHEVRFRDVRIIHAFLTQTLREALNVAESENFQQNVSSGYIPSSLQGNSNTTTSIADLPAQSQQSSDIQLLAILNNEIILAKKKADLILVDALGLQRRMLFEQLVLDTTAKNLLLPITIKLPANISYSEHYAEFCCRVGLEISQAGEFEVFIRALPAPLQTHRTIDFTAMLAKLFLLIEQNAPITRMQQVMVEVVNFSQLSDYKAQELLANLELACSKEFWRELTSAQCLAIINTR